VTSKAAAPDGVNEMVGGGSRRGRKLDGMCCRRGDQAGRGRVERFGSLVSLSHGSAYRKENVSGLHEFDENVF
jgi:hypothetical protein